MPKVLKYLKNIAPLKNHHFAVIIRPMLNAMNKIIGTVAIATDTLDKHRQIKSLENESVFEQLQLISPLIPANIYWLDTNNTILGLNEKSLQAMGLESYDEVIGKKVRDLYPQEIADRAMRYHSEAIQARTALQHEEVIKDFKTGKIKYFTTLKSPIVVNDKVLGSVGISIDVTERKNMEQELNIAKLNAEHANLLKTNFIQNMQHDIRTPATSVWAVLDNLVTNHQVPDEELLIMLRDSAKQLMEICSDVIDFNKIEQGDTPVLAKRFNIRQVLNNIIDLNKITAFDKGLVLSLSVDEKIPQVLKGDEYRLSRLLINLLGNALKFTAKGSILLSASLVKELERSYIIQFKLQDTGIGMRYEQQSAIYEKFNILNPANLSNYKGSGLGLRIVKKYVDDLGGEINVQSELNKGSIFFIDIPFAKVLLESVYDDQLPCMSVPVVENDKVKSDKKFATVDSGSIKLQQDKTYNVLLIEDNVLALNIGKVILQSLNCRVTTAVDVSSSLQALQQMKFDLVVSDIGLPDGTGADVLSAVKKDSQAINFATPFCLLTANNESEVTRKIKNAGFVKILTKPMIASKLQAILDEYVVATVN